MYHVIHFKKIRNVLLSVCHRIDKYNFIIIAVLTQVSETLFSFCIHVNLLQRHIFVFTLSLFPKPVEIQHIAVSLFHYFNDDKRISTHWEYLYTSDNLKSKSTQCNWSDSFQLSYAWRLALLCNSDTQIRSVSSWYRIVSFEVLSHNWCVYRLPVFYEKRKQSLNSKNILLGKTFFYNWSKLQMGLQK